MTRKTRIIIIAAIAVLIAVMALLPTLKRTEKAAEAENAVPPTGAQKRTLSVNAMVLEAQKFDVMVPPGKGRLLPDEEVDLSFETSGKVSDIYFKEGSYVKKGDLLARVNDKPLQAELQKLLAQMPLAEDRVKRQQQLLEKDAVSLESFESVKTDLEKLEADIQLVKAKIAQTELRAPFDGMIGLRLVSEGTYASPTTVVSNLTKISPLKLEFSVSENQAYEIKAGTPIRFSVDNGLNFYNATVYAVETRIDPNTITLKARALFDNPGGKLKPGHSAMVEVKIAELDNTIVVPSIAVVLEMGRDFVYLYKNGKARQRVITKGIRNESSLQVVRGLEPGDTLITTGVMQLRDGMDVKIEKLLAPGQ